MATNEQIQDLVIEQIQDLVIENNKIIGNTISKINNELLRKIAILSNPKGPSGATTRTRTITPVSDEEQCTQTLGKCVGLTSNKIKEMKCHNTFIQPKSQLDFYKEHNSSKEIMRYVSLQGKSFGEKYMEQFAKEFFNLGNRLSSTHDHVKSGKTIEQKSARYHANGGDWKWQHIEMTHDWDYLLLCGLDFQDIKFFISSRKTVEELINSGVIVGQGKKKNGVAQPQQAYWFSRSDFSKKNKLFSDYFLEVSSEETLKNTLNH
jgi:hypothetical protein